MFGFSPFVIAHSNGGHLNFTWLFLLPVILMLVEDLLWRAERPLWPQAPLLGLVIAVQLFIGSEALFICSLGCAAVALVIGALDVRAARSDAGARSGRGGRGRGGGCVVRARAD